MYGIGHIFTVDDLWRLLDTLTKCIPLETNVTACIRVNKTENRNMNSMSHRSLTILFTRRPRVCAGSYTSIIYGFINQCYNPQNLINVVDINVHEIHTQTWAWICIDKATTRRECIHELHLGIRFPVQVFFFSCISLCIEKINHTVWQNLDDNNRYNKQKCLCIKICIFTIYLCHYSLLKME